MTCPNCGARNAEGAGVCVACGRGLGAARPIGPGALIASRYEVLRQLGAGGMGVVFEAHDRKLDLRVAVKILRASSLEQAAAGRFRSEIKLAWKVRHKNVASIHEYGEDGDLLFISMELVNGLDLRRLLHERGAFLWEQGYDVALQIGAGLEAIHESGVIHRDLKSANVMIEPSGLVRVMDFGIAKAGNQLEPGLTATGQVVGSPEYMSPEQVRGRALDFRSDLYAFGIVIYEIFTGSVPFHGDSPIGTMLMHLQDPPPLGAPDTAQIPTALVEVLGKALSKDPDGRHASCREMNDALRAARTALEAQPTDATPAAAASARVADSGEPSTRSIGRRPGKSPAAALEPAPPEARLLLPTLMRALSHPQLDVRASAARCIASLGARAEPAVVALQRALQDPASGVRLEAARALAGMGPGSASALAALDEARAHEDSSVRSLVTETLTRLTRLPVDRAAPRPAGAPLEPRSRASPGASAAEIVPAASSTRTLPPAESSGAAGRAAPPVPQPRELKRLAPAPRGVPAGTWTPVWLLAIGAVAVSVVLGLLWSFRTEPQSGATVQPNVSDTPAALVLIPEPSWSPSAEPSASASAPPSPSGAPLPTSTTRERALPNKPSTSTMAAAKPAATPPATPAPQSVPTTEPSEGPPPPETLVRDSDEASSATPAPSEPATPPPLVVRIGELVRVDEPGVTPPQKLTSPPPAYPPLAVQRNREGTVELRVLVDENGRVEKVEIVKPVELLTEAAVKAVRRWIFRPARKHGVPVKIWITQPVQFRLSQ